MSDRHDVTDLHFAAQAGDVEAIARLVAAGADVNARDKHGNTPLKYATAEPVPAAVRKLIALGADVNLGDDRGFTPLHCAAAHGFYALAVEIAEALLARGADVNARSREFGFVPLHEATGADVIRLLVARGADPNIRSDAGLTPLEYMIEEERLDDAEHLRQSLRTGRAV
ncbi:MAG TPA: ankyrin repeat domain-containing protein [Tepidisphaeraceae bacterium]|nr:ankyrin repeat domain-containing protein [Tepidisphaeraceae bacterium]